MGGHGQPEHGPPIADLVNVFQSSLHGSQPRQPRVPRHAVLPCCLGTNVGRAKTLPAFLSVLARARALPCSLPARPTRHSQNALMALLMQLAGGQGAAAVTGALVLRLRQRIGVAGRCPCSAGVLRARCCLPSLHPTWWPPLRCSGGGWRRRRRRRRRRRQWRWWRLSHRNLPKRWRLSRTRR